ncbi:hypothetical protein GCM10010230_32300 [Streptomyces narbonensis]|nr:hypothetical protein GCM10010230_32300 [Streptomyces narbonensis]
MPPGSALSEHHGHRVPQPRTPRTPDEPPGPDPPGPELLKRERGGTEDVPLGTADDGAFHGTHQVPSPTHAVDETATLGDQQDTLQTPLRTHPHTRRQELRLKWRMGYSVQRCGTDHPAAVRM